MSRVLGECWAYVMACVFDISGHLKGSYLGVVIIQ